MNHCPVYTRVGGHAYEAVIPGPIGKILSDRSDLHQASSLCGACVEVCPVEIPITRLMIRLRGRDESRRESFAWRMWRRVFVSPRLYGLVVWFWRLLPLKRRPARRTLHELLRGRNV